MKGLLLKEYYALKMYLRSYAAFILIFAVASIFSGEPSFFGAMVGVMVFSLPISSFTIDEGCNWNRMALTTPASRNQIIGGKYLLCLSFAGLALLLSIIVSVIVAVTRSGTDVLELLIGCLSSLLLMSFVNAVLIPFVIKLGADRARVIIMLGFGLMFAVFVGAAGLLRNAPTLSLPEPSGGVVLVVVVAVTLLAYFISYKVSCSIYRKKQF